MKTLSDTKFLTVSYLGDGTRVATAEQLVGPYGLWVTGMVLNTLVTIITVIVVIISLFTVMMLLYNFHCYDMYNCYF